MPFSISPSVTITERDLSSIIPASSTTTAAFVGRFDKGPVDVVVDISSEKELTEIFGRPNPGERGVDWFVAANFLNYSDKLKVVRVNENDGTFYSSTQGGLTAASLANGQIYVGGASAGGFFNDNVDRAELRAKAPGVLGNGLRVVFFPAGSDPFDANVNGETQNGLGYTPIAQFDVDNVEPGLFSYVPTTTSQVFESFSNGILSGITQDEVHFAVIDQLGSYNETFGVTGAVLEKFEGLSLWRGVYDQTGRSIYYKDYINANSNFVEIEESVHRSLFNAQIPFAGNTGGDPLWSPTSSFVYGPLGLTGPHAGHDASHFYQAYNARLAGGAEAGITLPYDGVGSDSATVAADNPHTFAIQAAYNKHFSNADEIDIDILIGGAAEERISKKLVDIAEQRKDCVVFISPPSSPSGTEYNDIAYQSELGGFSGAANIIKYRNDQGFNSNYAVMDTGWKQMFDTYNDRFRWVPLNADTAGIVARTEDTIAPFFSPAGFNRGRVQGVVKLAINPTKAERDELYAVGINPVVSFPGEGAVLFGDKTLQRRSSSLDRINVRRLLITLEKAISTAAKFQLFEFNDDFTRRSFKASVEPFLRRIQSERGITDFRVVCDETNNTSEVISQNQFVADIFIKPAQSINFINLNFSVLRADATFSESVS